MVRQEGSVGLTFTVLLFFRNVLPGHCCNVGCDVFNICVYAVVLNFQDVPLAVQISITGLVIWRLIVTTTKKARCEERRMMKHFVEFEYALYWSVVSYILIQKCLS